MKVSLVYAHVTSVEGRDLYTRILCNRLSRDNTRVLDKLDLTQTPCSITILFILSAIILPVKDATTQTVENQLCRLRKLTTAKPIMTSQISRSTKILSQSQAKESKSTVRPTTSTDPAILNSCGHTKLHNQNPRSLCTGIHNTRMHTHTNIHSIHTE